MKNLFKKYPTFNEPIGNWNVTYVTNMTSMFEGCTEFNQDLSNWNISNVGFLDRMFKGCTKFNKPLNNWKLGKYLLTTSEMFKNCTEFNQDLKNWVIPQDLLYMIEMFSGCTKFNKDLSSWNVFNVQDMSFMFYNCKSFNINPKWTLNSGCRTNKMFDGTPLYGLEFPTLVHPMLLETLNPNEETAARSEYDHPSLRPVTPAATTNAATTTNATTTNAASSTTELLPMNEINSKIMVFNPLSPFGDETATVFLDEQSDYSPFIIRAPNGVFSGDAIKWPASSEAGKIYVECIDTAEESWQGFETYKTLIKPNAREFIKMNISGAPLLVKKPSWYNSRTFTVPGTKYFDLVKAPDVLKFMSKVLTRKNKPSDYVNVGAEHCNQKGTSSSYTLREMSHSELDAIVKSQAKGGRRRKYTKKRKSNKKRQTKKYRRK